MRSTPSRPSGPKGDWFWGLLLVAIIAASFWPLWRAGYIWDDRLTLTENPVIIGPLGLKEIWTTDAAQFYPLVLTTLWLEHALWGLAPMPYHLVNLAWHAACALALWKVLRLLAVPGAWLGAAIWALHPVEVESVAWITEMKNTESGLFFLLSIYFFARWVKDEGCRWSYPLCLICAALALAGKSSTAILPLVLCLCAWWIERRWQWRNLVRTAPVFLMSAISAALALWTVDNQGVNNDPQWATTGPQRCAVAGDAIWFYLGKLVWPHPLIAIYPRWQIDPAQATSYLPLLAALLVLAMFWLQRAAWGRPWFFAYAYFLVALLPVLGFVNHFILRFSFVFDHFQYLASMGPLALAGAGLARYCEGRPPWRTGLAAAFLLLLGLASCQRAFVFTSAESLWTDAVAKNPTAWAALDNLGIAIDDRGHPDEAIPLYRRSIELNPTYADSHNNLANALLQKKETLDAIDEYRAALILDPNHAKAHNGLGLALLIKGRADEAITEFRAAVKAAPLNADAQDNLGLALEHQGHADEALAHYRSALKSDPRHGSALFHLGNLLLENGHVDEAAIALQSAAEVRPDDADIHNEWGGALLLKSDADQALLQFQKATSLDPANAGFQRNLGIALLRLNRPAEAVEAFRTVTAADPDSAEAHYTLGLALAQSGRADGAIPEFERALQLKPGYAEAQKRLQQARALQSGK